MIAVAMVRLTRSLAAIAFVLGGCAKDSETLDDPEIGGTTTAVDSNSSTQAQTTSTSPSDETSTATTPHDESSSGATSYEPIYDLGVIPDTPVPADMGCKGIDFLFAIDNSGSMGAQQGQLLASFPGFIAAIQNSLENVSSYHVGVISSDAYTANEPGCTTIGDLVSRTQAGGDCGPFEQGGRFATQEDDLETVFPCMANVGTFGSPIEQPVTASIAAVSEEKAEPGACNEDFLRSDSILVLVVVTDDPPHEPDFDDAHPDTDTSEWYDSIIAAKGGNPEAVVVIGFIPWSDLSCVVFNVESPNLVNFVDAFGDQGIKASICEDDFGPVFASTVETIQFTCDNYIPQG
jgi:hypothetical protein